MSAMARVAAASRRDTLQLCDKVPNRLYFCWAINKFRNQGCVFRIVCRPTHQMAYAIR